MTQTQSLPGQTSLLPPEPPQPKSIKELVKEFAKQPGLDSYKNAGDQIEMLTTYLWLRQLTPSLPFETFLQCFAPVADFNEENRKHPADAIRFHCPRRADKVPEGGHQWTAAEIADFTTLYVDMVRTAEQTNTPVPLTFDQFLERLGPQYLAGVFNEPEPPAKPAAEKPKRKSSSNGAAGQDAVVVRPTAAGQRIVYTQANNNNRQIRGVVTAVTSDNDRQYVSFQADGGELFQDVAATHCCVIDAPPPPGYMNTAGQPVQIAGQETLIIPRSVIPQVRKALELTAPMGNTAIGDPIFNFEAGFGEQYSALVEVMNGETGPFVDSRFVLISGDEILIDLPPRKNIEGKYEFNTRYGLFVLEVKARE
jgi:hypothetical protein